MKNLLYIYHDRPDDLDDLPEFEPVQGRSFREVLKAVERGEEELGDTAPTIEYHFPTPDTEIDMDLPCDMFVSKNKFGSLQNEAIFVDRLRERLGLYDTVPAVVSSPPVDTSPVD